MIYASIDIAKLNHFASCYIFKRRNPEVTFFLFQQH